MRRSTPALAALAVLAVGSLAAWATGAQELPAAASDGDGLRFEGVITLGQVLQIAALVGWAVAFWGRFRVVESRVATMWTWFGRQVPDLDHEDDGR